MTFMGYPRVLELVKNRYYADSVISVDRADMALLFQEEQDYPASLREFFKPFDLIGVIGLSRRPFVRNLRKISKARVAVVAPFPPKGEALHMVDHLLSLPRRLGLSVRKDLPRVYLLCEDRDRASEILVNHGIQPNDALIAIHPGSGGRGKTWPVERFLELADNLLAAYPAQIVFIVGPGDERIKEVLLKTVSSKFPVILDSLALPHIGGVLERCCVYVGNDSGITHMAAAIGVPVVTIFGPSDPVRWTPRGRKVILIRRAVSCSPCEPETMSTCELRHCLLGVSVDEVFHAVSRSLEKTGEAGCPRMLRRFAA